MLSSRSGFANSIFLIVDSHSINFNVAHSAIALSGSNF